MEARGEGAEEGCRDERGDDATAGWEVRRLWFVAEEVEGDGEAAPIVFPGCRRGKRWI